MHASWLLQEGQTQLTSTEWATLTEALALLSSGLAAAQRASLIEPSALAAAWEAGHMAQLLTANITSHAGMTDRGTEAQNGRTVASHQDAMGPGGQATRDAGGSRDEIGQDRLILAGTALSGTLAGKEARAWCLKQLLHARYVLAGRRGPYRAFED